MVQGSASWSVQPPGKKIPCLLSDAVDIRSLDCKNLTPAPSESEVKVRIVMGPGVRLGWILPWESYKRL